MKLRNKKTGDIGELQITEKHCAVAVGNGTASCGIEIYSSLAELNEEWEDVPEEPKEYWHIDFDGSLMQSSDIKCDKYVFDKLKEIGNYFETKEEAEKAVEKLKAAKRLKNNGFRFDSWDENHHNLGIIEFSFCSVESSVYDFEKDLDLLFGGEE